jgi:flagellar hook-basal body complex protein FliE
MKIDNSLAINNAFGNADNNSKLQENGDFKNILTGFLTEANKTDYDDKTSNVKLMTGEADNTHEAMIAAEKADIALRLTIQIRNKVIDAYNEIMRMQI